MTDHSAYKKSELGLPLKSNNIPPKRVKPFERLKDKFLFTVARIDMASSGYGLHGYGGVLVRRRHATGTGTASAGIHGVDGYGCRRVRHPFRGPMRRGSALIAKFTYPGRTVDPEPGRPLHNATCHRQAIVPTRMY